MDEDYWRRYHRRVRQRAGAQVLLLIAPIGIIIAVLAIFGPTDHPAGDIRDRLEFRVLAFGLFIALDLYLIAGSIRLLRRDDHDDVG